MSSTIPKQLDKRAYEKAAIEEATTEISQAHQKLSRTLNKMTADNYVSDSELKEAEAAMQEFRTAIAPFQDMPYRHYTFHIVVEIETAAHDALRTAEAQLEKAESLTLGGHAAHVGLEVATAWAALTFLPMVLGQLVNDLNRK